MLFYIVSDLIADITSKVSNRNNKKQLEETRIEKEHNCCSRVLDNGGLMIMGFTLY